MIDKKFQKFLCVFGIHKMPKWGDIECGSVTKIDGTELNNISVQRRICESCGARKVRIAV